MTQTKEEIKKKEIDIVRYHIIDKTIILSKIHSQIKNYIANQFEVDKNDVINDLKRICAYYCFGDKDLFTEVSTGDLYYHVYEMFFAVTPPDRLQRRLLEKQNYVYGMGHFKIYESPNTTLPEQDIIAMLSFINSEQMAESCTNKDSAFDGPKTSDYNLIYYIELPDKTMFPLAKPRKELFERQYIDDRSGCKEIEISQHFYGRTLKDAWYQKMSGMTFKVRQCLYQGDFNDIVGINDPDPRHYYKVTEGEWKDSLIYKYDTNSKFS